MDKVIETIIEGMNGKRVDPKDLLKVRESFINDLEQYLEQGEHQFNISFTVNGEEAESLIETDFSEGSIALPLARQMKQDPKLAEFIIFELFLMGFAPIAVTE